MKNMMDVINQIQEKSRNKRLSAAYEMYKELKIKIIENVTDKIEYAIIYTMLEGGAYTNVDLNQQEFSHAEEISTYFENKGFKVYYNSVYDEDNSKEYVMHISWGSKELNFQ
jgi:hypothetical protein